MNNVALGLVVGLLAGVAGGYAVAVFSPDTAPAAASDAVFDTGSLDERLARIEQKLDGIENPALTLQGRGSNGSGIDDEVLAALIAKRLDSGMRDSVRDSVREAWNDLGEPLRDSDPEPTARRSKKRVPLADAAAALDLSTHEEEALRDIYAETIEKALDIFAGEDGDREEVRRDFEALKQNPERRMALLGKYMPKIMPKIGEFMSLEAERSERIREAIGPEKADRLNSEFDIEERDPFGLQGNLRIDASGR